MKIWVWGLAALGLAALTAPTTVQADVVQVNMSLTLTGSATACGGPCVETLTGSFEWNTTTQALVGSPSSSFTGPINFGTLTVLAGSTDTDLEAEFTDPGGDHFTLGFDLGSGSPVLGSYTGVSGSPSAGEFAVVSAGCATTLCSTDLPQRGVTISPYSATVSLVSTGATPEPGTLGLTFTGLLGLTALGWHRTRSA